MNQFEIIHFSSFGLDLQEPMAAVTNWLISFFCFYAFWQLRMVNEVETNWWKNFFLCFSISTFLAGFGHLFFQYTGIPGKFPNWMLGVMSGYFAGNAMLVKMQHATTKKVIQKVLIFKAAFFIAFAMWKQNFVFVAVDAILTYVFFCGILGYIYFKRGFQSMKFMVLGVLVCLPSAFIFLLKINPHRWLNKDDLSHLFMLGCTICFYWGAKMISTETSAEMLSSK